MFARRSSFVSIDKLPCFNIAFLTCYLLVVGHVSSMSLDRQRREYQQQNDKQLELSESMLPEAESELLQNDMELVPAVDGNSDMYLLVPAASAVSQEQNLQTLTELNESQSSGNIESNSDMLMQESEDAPAVQFLNLPETKIRENLVASNELDEELSSLNEKQEQVSENMLNNIAEAAQEIESEIENELVGGEENMKIEELIQPEHAKDSPSNDELPVEHKYSETENEMIGVVKEQSNEVSAVALETGDPQETEKINEDSQLDVEPEESEISAPEFIHQSQDILGEGNASEVATTESDEYTPLLELAQDVHKDSEKFEEINQADEESKISGDNEHLENDESENLVATENPKVEATGIVLNEDKNPNEMELQANEKIPFETLEGNKNQTVEDTQEFDDNQTNKGNQVGEEIQNITEEAPIPDDESATKIEVAQAEQDNADRSTETQENQREEFQTEKNQFNEETQVTTEQSNDDNFQSVSIETQPADEGLLFESEAEPLPQSHGILETQRVENDQQPQAIDPEVTAINNKLPAKETDSDDSTQNLEYLPISTSDESDSTEQTTLSSESQTVEEFHKAEEETIADKESEVLEAISEEEIQSSYEEQATNEEVKNEEETLEAVKVKDDGEIPHTDDKDKNAEQTETVEEESQSSEETTPMEDTESAESFQSNTEPQPVQEIESNEESDGSDKVQIAENVQSTQEEDMQPEEVLSNKDSQAVEESQHEEETEAVEEVQLVENEHIQAVEDIKPVEDQSDEITQNTEVAEAMEESKPGDEDKFVEESQSTEDSQIAEESQTNADVEAEGNIQPFDDGEKENKPLEENTTEAELFDTTVANVEEINESLHEESEANYMQPLIPPPETQESESHEFAAEKQEANPLEISGDKPESDLPKEQVEEGEDSTDQPMIFNNESGQDVTTEIQKPLEDKDSDNISNIDSHESEPIKETISMLTTIVQVPANEELTLQEQQQHLEHNVDVIQQQQQQQQQQHEQLQEYNPASVETVISTTLKPINFNYASNASFTNPMSIENNNNIEQEFKGEQQIFNSKLRRYDGAQVWRIVVQNDRERKLAEQLQTKFDGQLWKEVKQEVDYLLKPQVLADAEKYVRAANLSLIVLIENLQKVIEVENPPAEEIAQLQNRKGYRLTWQAYHRLEDIHGYFDYLAKTYPDICSAEIIGYSIEKRPLKILKISNGNANNTGIWIDGGMHAREWISPAVVTYITHQIVEGWDDLPAYMRNINWYVHAVANPDGYEYSHTTDRLWRKNMRSHGRACPGVDLNRNFGYKWGGKGTSANPCSQTYRGSKAFSEPETFYISKFISNFPRETFKGYLSFHSYGQYILYPWGYDYHITKDMADLDLVARQAGTIITKSAGAKFTVGSSATTLYPAAGGSDDWAKGIAGIKYAYTIEMGDTGRYGFILPAEYIEHNGKNGLTIVQTVAKTITMGKNGRRRKLKAYKNH